MSVGTKALMAAGGGGSSNEKVLIPIMTSSTASGSRKYYWNYVNLLGEVQKSIDVTNVTGFPKDAGGSRITRSVQSTVDWDWIIPNSSNRILAVNRSTGVVNSFSVNNIAPPSQGIWCRAGEFVLARQKRNSGTTQQMDWLTINNAGTTPYLSTQTWTGWGNELLSPGAGACIAYDVTGEASFSNFGGYVSWQEGSSAHSFNLRVYFQPYSGTSLTGSPTSVFGPTSNYSRGSSMSLGGNVICQKYFDSNFLFYNKSGTLTRNQGTWTNYNNWSATTLTSPFSPGGGGWRTQDSLDFGYDTYQPAVRGKAGGVEAIYNMCLYYSNNYDATNYALMYADKNGSNALVGSGTTGLGNELYKANPRFMSGSGGATGPNYSMRRINDVGNIAIMYSDYTSNNNTFVIKIFNGATQQGSDITVTMDTSVCNEKSDGGYSSNWQGGESCEYGHYYSGSNIGPT